MACSQHNRECIDSAGHGNERLINDADQNQPWPAKVHESREPDQKANESGRERLHQLLDVSFCFCG
jgi:hypothetical protein